MAIQVNEVTNAAGTGSVDATDGITIASVAYSPSAILALLTNITFVSTEAELDTALAANDAWIKIAASFTITGQKSISSGTTIQAESTGTIITGAGITATEAMFNLAAGATDIRLIGLNMATAQTDIDCIAIQDTASRNEIVSCHLEVPVLTVRSAIYIDGQRNRIYNNEIDCNGSVSTPGCVLLDVNAANNSIVANVIE